MSFSDNYRKALKVALGGRSATGFAEKAGLPRRSIATILEGREPRLSRAAEIADALDLELCVRRKGEVINTETLRLALLGVFVKAMGTEFVLPRGFASRVARTYEAMNSPFETTPPDEWATTAETLEATIRAVASDVFREEYAGHPPEVRDEHRRTVKVVTTLLSLLADPEPTVPADLDDKTQLPVGRHAE